ncbi:N-ATPase subunit AtpR [Defluviimonas sp. SAOS-178_SWC]|uniref:N-ATPase subunit AtpR n=1 Tax=Defluviimonas sp. SAOS-178_SWC TaxID=3121287 RepID=UPI00322182B8
MTDIFQTIATFPGAWLVLPLVAFGIGYIAGAVHFRALEGIARRIVAGDLRAIALQVGRMVLLGAMLAVLALIGAPTLIAGAAGVLLARARVLSRTRGAG